MVIWRLGTRISGAAFLGTMVAGVVSPTLGVSCVLGTNIDAVNRRMTRKAEAWMSSVVGGRVRISTMSPDWKTGSIVLNDIHVDGSGSTSVMIDRVHVTFSLFRHLLGRGIVDTCSIHGVRGTVDPSTSVGKRLGNVELGNVSVENMQLTVAHPTRPYDACIFSARLPRFRTSWALYDVLTADQIVGVAGKSPFWIMKTPGCDQISHVRIQGFQATGLDGDSEMQRRNVDIDATIFVPGRSKHGPTKGLSDLVETLEQTRAGRDAASIHKRFWGLVSRTMMSVRGISPTKPRSNVEVARRLVQTPMDCMGINLDVSCPGLTVSCHVEMKQQDFENVWLLNGSDLLRRLSREVCHEYGKLKKMSMMEKAREYMWEILLGTMGPNDQSRKSLEV